LREPREAWLTRAEVEAHLESRESSRRSILAHVWLLCVAGLGCGPGGDRAGADVSTLTVLYPGEERILGPYWDMPAKFLMFLPLVAYDEEGELEGRLAKRWEHSADYRTWTIHLRPDVLWHDGVPFTAQDVKYTLDMKKNPDVLAVAPDAYSVAVLDDSTLTITDNTGVGINPLDAWMVYYPRHLLEDLDPGELASWDFWTHPVGNGPYRYVRHVPKTMMEFEANPDYYAGRPRIDRLILKFGESSVAELLSGNVDVGGWVIPSEALKLAQDDRFRVYWEDSGTPRAILWKASHRLFRDVRVRRALTHAINRRELHQVLNLPEGLTVFDVLSTERQFRRAELPQPLPYDPDLARTLLDEAGWADADGDGVLEREGKVFQFELVVPDEVAGAGVYIQDQLRRVGVRVDLLTLGINMLRPRWRAGDFEAIIAFVNKRQEFVFFGEKSLLGYDNARAAELLSVLEETVDPAVRDSLYRELMPIFQAEQPATFLFRMAYYFVAHRRVRGLSSPWGADPLTNLEHLSLEEEP
jgi:peptide/nickel transport system substrate-binding protein